MSKQAIKYLLPLLAMVVAPASAFAVEAANPAAIRAQTGEEQNPGKLVLIGEAAAGVNGKSTDSATVAVGAGLGISFPNYSYSLTINKTTAGTVTGATYKDFSQQLLAPDLSTASALVEIEGRHWGCNTFFNCKGKYWGPYWRVRLSGNQMTVADQSGTLPNTDVLIYSGYVGLGLLASGTAGGKDKGVTFNGSVDIGPTIRVVGGDISTSEMAAARQLFIGSDHTYLPGIDIRAQFRVNNLKFGLSIPFLFRGGELLRDGALILSATVDGGIMLGFDNDNSSAGAQQPAPQ